MAAIPDPAPAPALKPVQALLMLLVICVGVAGFIALSSAVGSAEFYIGYFFLFYWAGLQHASFAELPGTVLGALFGVALGFALQQLVVRFGVATGSIAFIALVAVVLYALLTGLFGLVINQAAMLFLTLTTISHLQAHASFRGMFINLAVAVVFFGGLIWLATRAKVWADARSLARAKPA